MSGAEGNVTVVEHQYIKFDLTTESLSWSGLTYCYNLFELPDGRLVPYLWQDKAAITPVFEHAGEESGVGQAAISDRFFTCIATTPKEKLAGFILDNRSNSGGYQDDLDYLIGSYINEEVETVPADGPQ